jgi:hypothetical protein
MQLSYDIAEVVDRYRRRGPERGTSSMPATMQKAAEPSVLIRQLQKQRDALEVAGDLEGARLITEAINNLQQAGGAAITRKLAPSPLIKQQIDRLHQLANTELNPAHRADYQRQYDALCKVYSV